MIKKALEKIDNELKEFKGGQKEKVVSKYVADVLKSFSKQEEEFAQSIVQSDKTLSDCCKKIMSGVGSNVSDLEVYKNAVAFYFPGAGINFSMTIDLCASVRKDITVSQSNATQNAEKKTALNISLDDLLKM